MEEKKLLIVHHGALGDVVATFPAVIRLQEIFSRIDLLCQRKLGKLAQSLNVVDGWFSMEAASFASLYSSVVDPEVKQTLQSYHAIIIFSRSRQLQSAIQKTTGKTPYLIQPRPDNYRRTHIAEHVFSSMVRFGLLAEVDPGPNSVEYVTERPPQRPSKYYLPKILIHPGSGSRKKCWPVSNFANVASSIVSDGNEAEFILGPAEHFLADILSQKNKHHLKIHIMNDLIKVSSLLKTADGFIGNDSGISHLAAFMGLPTVAVFGPSDPKRWKPMGRAVAVVRPDLDCKPCFEINTVDCTEMVCFNKTSPETVSNAFYKLVKRAALTGGGFPWRQDFAGGKRAGE